MLATKSNSAAARTARESFFWVSHYQRCLSFHSETEYGMMRFPDPDTMWQQIRYFIDRGYRVQ